MRKIRTIEMQRLSIEEYKKSEKLPLVVVLDDVRSMYNIGSVFRTADTFRVEAVCLCGICQTPPATEIHKTALGAEESVDWRYYKTAFEAVNALKNDGTRCCRWNKWNILPSCSISFLILRSVMLWY